MKKDDEVEESMRETTVLVNDTKDAFVSSFRNYVNSLVNQMTKCAENIRRDGLNNDSRKELAAITESMNESVSTMRKHLNHISRGMKVVNHKNAVHANDRLFAALERMKRDAKTFQVEMDALATGQSARKRMRK